MIRITIYFIVLLACPFLLGCAEKSYPGDMTKEERKAYYKEYNESKTEAEWAQVREENQLNKNKAKDANQNKADNADNTATSIAFSVKNNSLLPKKLKIVDNIVDFKPFEKRYFGFEPNTQVFLLKGETEKYLFTLTENDKGKEFKIAN